MKLVPWPLRSLFGLVVGLLGTGGFFMVWENYAREKALGMRYPDMAPNLSWLLISVGFSLVFGAAALGAVFVLSGAVSDAFRGGDR